MSCELMLYVRRSVWQELHVKFNNSCRDSCQFLRQQSWHEGTCRSLILQTSWATSREQRDKSHVVNQYWKLWSTILSTLTTALNIYIKNAMMWNSLISNGSWTYGDCCEGVLSNIPEYSAAFHICSRWAYSHITDICHWTKKRYAIDQWVWGNVR